MLALGGLIFILLAAFLADQNPDLGKIFVAVIAGLALVWAVGHADDIRKLSSRVGLGG